MIGGKLAQTKMLVFKSQHQAQFKDRCDFLEHDSELLRDIAALVNDKDFAFFLVRVDARSSAAGPGLDQIGVGIAVDSRREHAVTNRRYGLGDTRR